MARQFSTDESRGVIFEPLEVENMSLQLASVASLVESEDLMVESRSPEVEYCSRMELSEPGEVEYCLSVSTEELRMVSEQPGVALY